MSWMDTLSPAKRAKADELLDKPFGERARKYMGEDREFGAWLVLVDAIIMDKLGVSMFDLADRTWHDNFSDEMSPAEAAQAAIFDELGMES